MKQKILLAIILAIACSFITANKPLWTKTFSYVIWSLDPKSLTPKATLEQSTAMIQTKGKTSNTSFSYTISNAKSLIRIKINDAFFQTSGRVELGGPSDYISLYKLSTGKSRSFTVNTDGTTNTALVPVNFIPTETSAYTKINPMQPLVPGEYAFVDMSSKTADGNITVWTFGIDY